MVDTDKTQVLGELRERLASGDLDEVTVTLRVAGGMPGEQLAAREVALAGTGEAHVRAEQAGEPSREGALQLEDPEVFELLRKLGDSGEDLLTAGEARFVPDSLVGAVTITVGSDEITLYYLADEGQREDQRAYLSPPASEALEQLSGLAERALEPDGRHP